MDCDSMITVFNRKEYQEIKTRNYIWYIVNSDF